MATRKTKTAEAAETTETAEPETIVNLAADGEATTVTDETVEVTAEPEAVKAKAVKTYRDKNTGTIVTAGTVLTMTAERFAELSPRYVKRW